VRDGEDGLLVPREDEVKLADAIRRVVSSNSLAETLRAAGKRRVADDFSEQHVVARYFRLIATLRERK
jgi:glycosyltransferase involved in cell wall biosynthesis